MENKYFREYLEALQGIGSPLPIHTAVNGLIDVAGKLYSHSSETEPLIKCELKTMERLEKRTGLKKYELDSILTNYLSLVLEQIADAYSKGFRDAIEEISSVADLLA